MKKINKKAAVIFNKILQLLGEKDSLKIDNAKGAYMYVCIDRLMSNVELCPGNKFDVYSLAHYYESNGDLVCDPDMTFAVSQNSTNFIYPMSYQDSMICRQSIVEIDGVWKVNVREQADEAIFAGTWLINIGLQQKL